MGRYGNNKAYVDDSVFQKRARKLARKLKVDEDQFIKQQTGLLARDLAKWTPPWAKMPNHKGSGVGTKADIDAGKNALRKDLRSICIVIKDERVADTVKNFGSGPIYGKGGIVAPKIITTQAGLKAWHRTMSNARGRTKSINMPDIPMVGRSLYEKYLKKEQDDVGIAKAVFYHSSKLLEAKGSAPVGVKKQTGRSGGTGSVKKTSKGPVGSIGGSADGLFHTNRFIGQLQRVRLEKAFKRLKFIAKKVAKDSGFKVN